MAQGNHPFPSRTRKLSPAAPMVLPLDGGRVGRCQAFLFARPQRTLRPHGTCPVCRRIWALVRVSPFVSDRSRESAKPHVQAQQPAVGQTAGSTLRLMAGGRFQPFCRKAHRWSCATIAAWIRRSRLRVKAARGGTRGGPKAAAPLAGNPMVPTNEAGQSFSRPSETHGRFQRIFRD